MMSDIRSAVGRALMVVVTLLAASSCAAGADASAAGPALTPTPTPPAQVIGNAELLAQTCEWSTPTGTRPEECFATRPAGFRVGLVYPSNNRWFIYDYWTRNVAYVDRAALRLPAGVETGAPAPIAGPKTAIFCIDRSSSYHYTAQALTAAAEWIADAARPGDRYAVRWIEENSYRPQAAVGDMLALRSVPAKPFHLVPAPTPALFNRTAVARATATTAAMRTAVAQATATQAAAVEAAQQDLQRWLDALRGASAPPARSSDALGCMKRSSEILASEPGDRYLFIASHLLDSGVTPPDFNLDRVRVRVVFFDCLRPAECALQREAWTVLAGQLGAPDITFLDPSRGMADVEA